MEGNEIIQLFFDRDERAIAALSEKYKAYCRKIAENILGSREDSEECVNDVFLKVWELIPPNKPKQLSAYVGRLTRNAAIDKLKRRTAEKRGGDSNRDVVLDELAEVIPDNSSVELEQERRELVEEINRFLKKLPTLKRNIFVRRYWYCDSVKEIAADYGIGESNVSVILNRTREKLRVYLNKKGMI